MRVHGLGRHRFHDDGGAGVALRAERAEQEGGFEAAVHNRPRAAAFLRPHGDNFPFLADAGLVLDPDLDMRRFGLVSRDLGDLIIVIRFPVSIVYWLSATKAGQARETKPQGFYAPS